MTNTINEPVGNSDKMTLTEFAHEIGKLLNAKYVTYEEGTFEDSVNLWEEKPVYQIYDSVNGYGSWQPATPFMSSPCVIYQRMVKTDLDLSEYENENGKVDYSKCIVEVSDDAE